MEKAKVRGNEAKYLEQYLATDEKYANFDISSKNSEVTLSNEQL